jgi:hypothetical protein
MQVRKTPLQFWNVSGHVPRRALGNHEISMQEEYITIADIMPIATSFKIQIRCMAREPFCRTTSIGNWRNRGAFGNGKLCRVGTSDGGNRGGRGCSREDEEAFGHWNISSCYEVWRNVVDNDVVIDCGEIELGSTDYASGDFAIACYIEYPSQRGLVRPR